MKTALLFIFTTGFLAAGVLQGDILMYFFSVYSAMLAVATYCRSLEKKTRQGMKQMPPVDISDETLNKVAMLATPKIAPSKAE